MKTLTKQIEQRKVELKSADPRSRDRLRHRLHALLKVKQIRKELRAA